MAVHKITLTQSHVFESGRSIVSHRVGRSEVDRAREALHAFKNVSEAPVNRFAARRSDTPLPSSKDPLADSHSDSIAPLAHVIQHLAWMPPKPAATGFLARFGIGKPKPASPPIPEPLLTMKKLASLLAPAELDDHVERHIPLTNGLIAASLRSDPSSIRMSSEHTHESPTPGNVVSTFPLFLATHELVPITRQELTTLPDDAVVTRMHAAVEEILGVAIAIARECGLDAYMVNMTFGARFQHWAPGLAVLDGEHIHTLSLDWTSSIGEYGHPSASRLQLYDDIALRGMLDACLAQNISRRFYFALSKAVATNTALEGDIAEELDSYTDFEAFARHELTRAVALLLHAADAIGEVNPRLIAIKDGTCEIADAIGSIEGMSPNFTSSITSRFNTDWVFDPEKQ